MNSSAHSGDDDCEPTKQRSLNNESILDGIFESLKQEEAEVIRSGGFDVNARVE
jgi:hypothetical protein